MRWGTRSLLAFVAAAAVLTGAGCGDEDPVTSDAPEASTPPGDTPAVVPDDAPEPSQEEIDAACADAPPDTQCGITFEELRDLNMRYADRMEFLGDPADAAAMIVVVRERLEPFVGSATTPTEEEVLEALDGLGFPQASASAVRANGTGFGVDIEGGCVFGDVFQGDLTVEFGGYINDGGCLAVYGH